MTKRPILVGIAAVLVLALTAGLAFGAGRLMGTRLDARTARHEHAGLTEVVPATFANHGRQVHRTPGYRSALRSQVRGWMHDWMGDHGWNPPSRAVGYGRPGAAPHQRSGAGSHWNAPQNGFWGDHHDMWGHSGSSGSRYGGYHQADPGHGHCW